MTRQVSLSTLALIFAVLALSPPPSLAADGADAKSADIPLRRVVMFSSGVGYYERRGDVQDDAKIDLRFAVKDINDLLKSMVLQDLGDGRISTVTYGSKDPITKTLKTFAIDLTTNPTLAQILDQVRGEKIEIEAPEPVTGTILGVERRKRPVGKDPEHVVEIEVLNLLTDKGLRSVPLENVGRIKLSNEKLDAELRQALAVLATSHATDKKTVTINFQGKGKRPVRVGYIGQSPIWKTSYRLVLDEKQPLLQGWAIVENTSDEDWKEVGLTLVSGRPISFIMDLYQPLYVQRPLVQLELYASLRPQTYDQDLAEGDKEFRRMAERKRETEELAMDRAPSAPRPADKKADFAGRGQAAVGGGYLDAKQAEGDEFGLKGVKSMAQGGSLGEMFQYTIASPVTLDRGRSAMLPIVNESVEGEKVSIYNPAVQPKHPLAGLRLKNTTGLHLMQGPITVFDGKAYAGDAQIQDLPSKSERLISYAVDLDTEVAPESKSQPQFLVSIRLIKGVMQRTHKYARSQLYTVKNSGAKAKKVLIEYPLDPNWTLIAPKEPAEKTRTLYRFAVAAEPGKPAKLSVDEERVVTDEIALVNLDDNTIRYYLSVQHISDAVKKALAEVVQRKQAIQVVVAKRTERERQSNVIRQQQDRIRENLKVLPRDSEIGRTYIKKFTDQETDIDRLAGEITELVAEETKLRQGLDEFLTKLDLK